MTRRVVAITAALTCFCGSGPAVFSESDLAEAPTHYFYFKERRPLTLDVSRVAVLRTTADAAGPSLLGFGVDEGAAEPSVVSGWWLVPMTDGARTAGGVVAAVRGAAASGAVDFVSPIFVGNDGGPLIVTPDILVGFDRGVDPARAEAILVESGAGVIVDRDWGNMKRAYRLRGSSRDGYGVLAAANRLAERPEVRFAEPDMIFTGRGSLIPNDPGFGDCWGLHNTGQFGGTPDADMDAPEAWDTTIGDPSIIVLIIDTGVEQDHPDINQVPGNDLTSDPSVTGDPVNACDNHGTAVAGCVSATINNALGTVGVAPGTRSASARTFISVEPCTGAWTSEASWTVDALAWAESIGARVTNNSNYYGFQSSAIAEKYQDTRGAGIVHFAIAGNFARPVLEYPGSLTSVNAVSALNPNGTLASFSSYGPGLDFSAPGTVVYTTDRTGFDGYSGDDYVFVQGTSFATPYTAGVAALALSVNPALTASQVEQVLQLAAVDLGVGGYDTTYGWGFVNAARTVLFAAKPPPECHIPPSPSPDPVGIKVRHVSFTAGEVGRVQAVRMRFETLPAPFGYADGRTMWVGPPTLYTEAAGKRLPSEAPGAPTFWGATLQCSPFYADWTGYGLVHVFDPSVVPSGAYAVQAIDESCSLDSEVNFSPPLSLRTSRWGDVVSNCATNPCGPPDNVVNITTDAVSVANKFGNRLGAPDKPRVDMEPGLVDQLVNITDLTRCLDAFRGLAYPFAGPPPADPCAAQ
jgi:subtilisin family serine protease